MRLLSTAAVCRACSQSRLARTLINVDFGVGDASLKTGIIRIALSTRGAQKQIPSKETSRRESANSG